MPTYSERQIEAGNLLSSVEKEVSQDVIDQIVSMVGEAEREKTSEASGVSQERIDSIKLKLMETTDWRHRASLAAMIISKGLSY